MSFFHRAPRQVYRVYGEEEYLAEEHVASDAGYLHETEDPGSSKNGPEIHGPEIDRPEIDRPEIDRHDKDGPGMGVAAPPSESRTPRLVGVGLLLGVTVGAAGLVLSHLSHEASHARTGASAPSVSRRVSPTSSRPFRHRVSGEASAHPEPESQLGGGSTRRRSVSAYSPPRFAAHRRMSRSGFTLRKPIEAGQSGSAQRAGANWVVRAITSVRYQAPAFSAASGGEFEFERQAP